MLCNSIKPVNITTWNKFIHRRINVSPIANHFEQISIIYAKIMFYRQIIGGLFRFGMRNEVILPKMDSFMNIYLFNCICGVSYVLHACQRGPVNKLTAGFWEQWTSRFLFTWLTVVILPTRKRFLHIQCTHNATEPARLRETHTTNAKLFKPVLWA